MLRENCLGTPRLWFYQLKRGHLAPAPAVELERAIVVTPETRPGAAGRLPGRTRAPGPTSART